VLQIPKSSPKIRAPLDSRHFQRIWKERLKREDELVDSAIICASRRRGFDASSASHLPPSQTEVRHPCCELWNDELRTRIDREFEQKNYLGVAVERAEVEEPSDSVSVEGRLSL
jgi:hypothetical protein